jgi:hypothetical protein
MTDSIRHAASAIGDLSAAIICISEDNTSTALLFLKTASAEVSAAKKSIRKEIAATLDHGG